MFGRFRRRVEPEAPVLVDRGTAVIVLPLDRMTGVREIQLAEGATLTPEAARAIAKNVHATWQKPRYGYPSELVVASIENWYAIEITPEGEALQAVKNDGSR